MNKDAVLVTGGAGYIGSHVVKSLLEANHHVVVLDNLTTGFQDAILSPAIFVEGDIQDLPLLLNLLETYNIASVIHLAAHTVISESLENPLKYYQNNAFGTLQLIKACVAKKIKHFIFSSTAAVYGETETFLDEKCPTRPSNPYGHSKLMSERFLQDIALTSGLRFGILRYFNVAGASLCGKLGQRTKQASHLIKVAVETVCGLHPFLPIYGNQYPTPDGTCIRDFIHVSDLAEIHLQTLVYLQNGGPSQIFNCGYGRGFSVLEVVKALEAVTQSSLPIKIGSPRQGDIANVVANNDRIKKTLKWQPQFDDLQLIVKTALAWEKCRQHKLS